MQFSRGCYFLLHVQVQVGGRYVDMTLVVFKLESKVIVICYLLLPLFVFDVSYLLINERG